MKTFTLFITKIVVFSFAMGAYFSLSAQVYYSPTNLYYAPYNCGQNSFVCGGTAQSYGYSSYAYASAPVVSQSPVSYSYGQLASVASVVQNNSAPQLPRTGGGGRVKSHSRHK